MSGGGYMDKPVWP